MSVVSADIPKTLGLSCRCGECGTLLSDNYLKQVNHKAPPRFTFKAHSEYLQTPAWKSRRSKVLARARGICEGCGENPAVHVHHLTYVHWKHELLWELVAVCLPCHEFAHNRPLR